MIQVIEVLESNAIIEHVNGVSLAAVNAAVDNAVDTHAADHDAHGPLVDADIPVTIARDDEVAAAIAAHAGANDPHGDRAYADGLVSTPPIGSIVDAMTNPDPTKYLEMSGQWVSRATWPLLSAVSPAPAYHAPWSYYPAAIPSSSVYGLAWNGSVFCLICTGTVCYTSPDGVTWTSRTLPSGNNWRGIAWNGSMFVTVLSSSSIAATSPDGITWTQRALPATATWRAVAWNGSVFCALSGTNVAATSPDGITWTPQTMPTSATWYAISSDGNNFCALRYAGTPTVVYAATSPNGADWTEVALPSNISFSATNLVWNGTHYVSVGAGSVIRSTNGYDWTLIPLPKSFSVCGLAADPGTGRLLVVRNDQQAALSLDGSVWNEFPFTAVPRGWSLVCFGSDRAVAVVASGTEVAVSSLVTADLYVPLSSPAHSGARRFMRAA